MRKPVKPPVPLEQEEAAVFWRWWKTVRPMHKHVVIYCIDHGERLTYGQIAKAQARGYEGGVVDYGILVRGRAGYLELKRVSGGTLRENQKAFRDAVILAGGFHFVAKGAAAAIEFVTDNVLGAK